MLDSPGRCDESYEAIDSATQQEMLMPLTDIEPPVFPLSKLC